MLISSKLQELIYSLSESINEDEIGPSLPRPNTAFSGPKPLEGIERGEHDRIWQMIYELRSGVAF
jgi:hypothetical protein